MIRQPAVAGRFYSDDPNDLREEVRSHLESGATRVSAKGIVAPHAGFMYSGDVAGSVYSRIEIPETLILLGPNHTGMGERISVMTRGTWAMPMGNLEINTPLAETILKYMPQARENEDAHRWEHSLETQLPFLQFFRKEFTFVPICLMQVSLEDCRLLARALAEAIRQYDGPILIVASSDMTHYESHVNAKDKDGHAIDRMVDLDPEGLYETVANEQISMCGVKPATVMLSACRELGATEAELVKYMTSGEVNGDMDQVVGYAGLIVR